MPSFDVHAFFNQFLYDPKNPLLFNNGFFVFFFAVFISLYYSFRNNYVLRRYIFCFFSLYFFYKASGAFVVFVILSAIVDFVLSNLIGKAEKKSRKKFLLTLSIIFNLGLLCYFKYTNFFIRTGNELFHTGFNPLNILLPVGISFYTFENLSYTIDVYRGNFKPVKKFSEYLLFLSFFPKLVMGPIVRAHDFIPQINKPYNISDADFSKGFYLIISGLFKKLVISDYITLNFVNYIFDNPSMHTGLECLFTVYGYAVIIYCDFSGYSDVAIGIAKWMGFTIPPNFLSPYQSKNITEFWRRWHISLSSWLRDYLYIPLGGNRKGEIRMYVNLMITMLLGGLWHGASWNFVLWGGMHGVALAIHKLYKTKGGRLLDSEKYKHFTNAVSIFITFNFVCFCWIFFKSDSFETAGRMIYQITHDFDAAAWPAFFNNYKTVLGMMLLAFFMHAIPDDFADRLVARFKLVPLPVYMIIFFAFVLVYGYFKAAEPVMPIYLQF